MIQPPGTGLTPLHLCCAHGFEEMVKILIGAGSDCVVRDTEGLTPLYYASRRSSLNIIRMLLKQNSNEAVLNNQDIYGETCLHEASRYCQLDVMKELLRAGVDPDIVNDKNGMCYDVFGWLGDIDTSCDKEREEVQDELEDFIDTLP
jgi:ankyrin repeat protein